MLVRVPVSTAGRPVRLARLPPALALAGVLACGLPLWLQVLLALACAWRLLVLRAPPGGALQVDLAASGVARWRDAGGGGLCRPQDGCRVTAGGVHLAVPGQAPLALRAGGHAAPVRALARQLLAPPACSARWQPVLPRRGRHPGTVRRRLPGFGYNRALRVRRSPPCIPS